MGLLNYPVLMAADILLYHAQYVPVGKDQFQHLEITRDIATRFNNKFGDIFTIPKSTSEQMKFMSRDAGLRIRSLTDPTKKMSKSSDDTKSKINMHDDPKIARKKIMAAVTDNVGQINFNYETQPGISSLLHILALLQQTPIEDVVREWQGKNSYGELKMLVGDEVEHFLTNFQNRHSSVKMSELRQHCYHPLIQPLRPTDFSICHITYSNRGSDLT